VEKRSTSAGIGYSEQGVDVCLAGLQLRLGRQEQDVIVRPGKVEAVHSAVWSWLAGNPDLSSGSTGQTDVSKQ
jgi:hypothetical protein